MFLWFLSAVDGSKLCMIGLAFASWDMDLFLAKTKKQCETEHWARVTQKEGRVPDEDKASAIGKDNGKEAEPGSARAQKRRPGCPGAARYAAACARRKDVGGREFKATAGRNGARG